MGLPSINIAGKLVEDSAFAVGRSMFISKQSIPPKKLKLTQERKVLDILQKLSMAEALMTNSLVRLNRSYRTSIEKILVKLLHEGLIKNVCVATEHTIFKLWISADGKLPRNAQEACRLAILGIFFSLAKKEIPNFQWRVIRSNKSPILGEMTFEGKNGSEKWVIDVPRRGEKPQEKAHLYIFPTLEEAIIQSPNGKKFTSDIILIKDSSKPLKERIFEYNN
ncbi:hypothetical protein [Desulfofalx alkaliphila]|uniref:hypothetical protein n=1 Tax=Desulfofalx alkaliphila TaxID=105483 RepID=UPI0004E1EFCF|nr:hypothetical protein [Desulfofalx alkaliphila]